MRLCEAARQPVATHWVLRDIHLEHILFDSTQNHRRVSGIIDYDAVRVDTPAADLARFISSCGEVPSSWVVDAVRVYRESCRFCKHSESLIPLLMTSTSLIACANWTQWLCLEGRVFDAGREKAINRFQLAIEQAEMLFP
ncbi:MAG: phosphotransferase [Pirellulaceae bacterium]